MPLLLAYLLFAFIAVPAAALLPVHSQQHLHPRTPASSESPRHSHLYSVDAALKSDGGEGTVVRIQDIGFRPSTFAGSRQPLILLSLSALIAYKYPIPRASSLFCLSFPVYLFLANKFRFRSNANAKDKPLLRLLRKGGEKWFKQYVLTFAMVGLILPLLTVLKGCLSFTPLGIAPSAVDVWMGTAAAPHLVLVLVQCAMESITKGRTWAAIPRLLVPIGFNTWRLGSLHLWVMEAWKGQGLDMAAGVAGKFGVALAVVNAVLWTYNIFYFLLLWTLPQYLDERQFTV